ncbi:MAG: aminotransferase class III-fold pyridoxal phosphate-dependent enzyme [Spirochaetales bacterium]|nr:aminotransferase class III-fold pyridoxal phosphate-dependent enzyme [Spirochaetales bacterium]
MSSEYKFDTSIELFKRAADVIPGGIYGSKAPGFVIPGSYPYYFKRGKGCRLWDVDDNEYIDFLCGYGSQILGYGYDSVDEVAARQMRAGDLLNGPQPLMVELAEKLTDQVEGMDWSVFAKNGTDTTTLAVSIARVHTGKKKVIMAKGAYHGAANWCSTNDFPELTDKQDVLSFTYNDLEELRNLYKAYKGEIAAIILTPYHHPAFEKQVMPNPGFYEVVRKLSDVEGSLFILDDIRCNFRLSLKGSHVFFKTQPDLITMGKSIANGQPISVLMGCKEFMKTAGSFFITGTFWMSGVPFAASLETLKIMEEVDIIGHMNRMGGILKEGLISLGKEYGFSIEITGAPAIPFMTFEGDPDLFRNQVFCSEMTKMGIYLHPHHNWFISFAHKENDINKTLETAREAFAITAASL